LEFSGVIVEVDCDVLLTNFSAKVTMKREIWMVVQLSAGACTLLTVTAA